MKLKSFLTLDLKTSIDGIIENLYEEIVNILNSEHDLEFVDQLHITLDCVGFTELREAVIRLEKLLIKRVELRVLNGIKLGNIDSFISHSNGRRVFFINIDGGKEYFDCLREYGCNICTPHVTLFEMENVMSEAETSELLEKFNSNEIIKNLIDKILIDTKIIYLKRKTQDNTLKIIGRLRIS